MNKSPQLLLIGDSNEIALWLEFLPVQNFCCMCVSPDTDLGGVLKHLSPMLTLVACGQLGNQTLLDLADQFQARSIPWVAWLPDSSLERLQTLSLLGANLVLNQHPNSALLNQLLNLWLNHNQQLASALPQPNRRNYQAGERVLISTSEETVVVVQQGLVAGHLVHPDGSRYTLGFYRDGQAFWVYPVTNDWLDYELIAQSDTVVVFKSSLEVMADPLLLQELYHHLQFTEAWAAGQALLDLEERIFYKLNLLARYYGKPLNTGTGTDEKTVLLDLRLTHTQLAEVVGASRTTVTRALGQLRKSGLLFTTGNGNSERFCLTRPQATRPSVEKDS